MKLLWLLIVFVAVGAGGWLVWAKIDSARDTSYQLTARSTRLPASSVVGRLPSPTATPLSVMSTQPSLARKQITQNVPFTAQAPTGNWDDPLYQNACEEASILMAMRWAQGEQLTTQEALVEIKALSDYALKNYGHFHDLSAADTTRLLQEYYDYQSVRLVPDISAGDIKQELGSGNLVIAPVNGQLLNNPFFTPPGPLEHMLVVRGYDPVTDEFITNDPGTKRGGGFRYAASVLEQAIRDYPTGFHLPIDQVSKVMIVVERRSS